MRTNGKSTAFGNLGPWAVTGRADWRPVSLLDAVDVTARGQVRPAAGPAPTSIHGSFKQTAQLTKRLRMLVKAP